jgi:hypothetical protein
MSTCIVLGAGATLADAEHFHSSRQVDGNPPLDTNFFDRVRALRRPKDPRLARCYLPLRSRCRRP